MSTKSPPHFNRGVVEPIACLKEGWVLVKDRYWLFFGVTVVGLLIASVVPLGILMGPMMSGIYLTYFLKRHNQPIEFGTLFRGFDFFGQSLIATLIYIAPILIAIIPAYLLFYLGFFLLIQTQGDNPDPSVMLGFLGIAALLWFLIFLLILIVSVLFTFVYPLVVNRRLSGVEAVKLSIKASLANFWRLLGLFLLNALLGLVGAIFCYVGTFFILPITFGGLAVAYEKVFGLREVETNLPPPPPTFS